MPCPCQIIPYIVGGSIVFGIIGSIVVTYSKITFQALLILAILCTISFIIIPMLADQVYHINMDEPFVYKCD